MLLTVKGMLLTVKGMQDKRCHLKSQASSVTLILHDQRVLGLITIRCHM